ncbi:Late embryogenesis abundant protein [Parasponia andersonii]|uniref:Late embryogenesis abundant protein n=1 Tax=Parasponia andersonii TaxID=3476 RepID=A0A2P5BVE4_PARAD|nr:Late embryogenesis abundant protein [Parasponia andersonii]
MASTTFARGAHSMNSMFLKPLGRKAYHKNSAVRDTMKMEVEEAKNVSHNKADTNSDGNLWVPHARTGIYYPKGHEKVMEDVPSKAGQDTKGVNWFSYDDNIN